ncbi:alpha/beta hydrolase [Ramlibacter sp.]|uniref:alpha/beta fold hydrolase n=1 Tax=Ramlibacter sp. TaxID=1917967 RepID=UPI00263581F0|nr:alpha/beta hydrolase [Ramlibacter sp.]MDB5954761.1 alpha/beta hydrolase fold protein [Ramlibacter sp.]
MTFARTDDGVDLYYEVTGTGTPIIFIHEFAATCQSWEAQVRHFSRWYSCITFNARGYPPSQVPTDTASYSQQRAVHDAIAVLDHAGVARAHIVGLSMGGFAALHLGLDHPQRARSLCVAGAGYGAEPEKQEVFQRETRNTAALLLEQGIEAFAMKYSRGPTRLSFERNDPRGYAEFQKTLAMQSALGLANTQLGVQLHRPSLYSLRDKMRNLKLPTLIVNGDEDTPCLGPALMMKATIPSAVMSVIPNCGHTLNSEVPDEFNRILGAFMAQADSGRWPLRSYALATDKATGMAS